jgi:hypothetical protein
MQKHVASDGCVHGLCVDFENTRVHIREARELWIVASLAAAYNNSLTAQQLQYEADLYGRMYAPGEERAARRAAGECHGSAPCSRGCSPACAGAGG